MTTLPKEQFWMVYGAGNDRPTFQHSTRESAEAEAKRLARLNPGTAFVVLESISAVIKREFDTMTYRNGPARDGCVHGCDLPF